MSQKITRVEAADRIALFAREGRLIQKKFHAERAGRELACLLGAIGKDIGAPEDCPAWVMPAWMAYLILTLFDGVRHENALSYGARFADALRTGSVDDGVLRRFLVRTINYAVDAARPVSEGKPYWHPIVAANSAVAALIAQGVSFDDARMREATDAAKAAAGAASTAAEEAAWGGPARAAATWAAQEAAYEALFDALIEEMLRVPEMGDAT